MNPTWMNRTTPQAAGCIHFAFHLARWDRLVNGLLRIGVQVDVTFPRLPCDWISVVALDMSGRIQPEVDHDLSRQRLTARGKPISKEEKHDVGAAEGLPQHLDTNQPALPKDYCGSCYGAQMSHDQCCNTCEDVRQAYSIKGWNMPDYDKIEQCKREGYVDKYLAHVRPCTQSLGVRVMACSACAAACIDCSMNQQV